MISLQFDEFVKITGGDLNNESLVHNRFDGVSIDTRLINKGELFFAIVGEQNDGHNYVEQADRAGATGFVVEYEFDKFRQISPDKALIKVPNTHQALIDLAKAYRKKINPVCIGITGSNGKTTTKEFLFKLLEAVTPNVYASPGNYNNLYGIPLALLAMPQNCKSAVLEMGISQPGEMNKLASIVTPNLMIFTNIGATHLEFLKTTENVAREKLSALASMDQKAPVIINADDELLMQETKKLRSEFTTFGLKEPADFTVSSIDQISNFETVINIENSEFILSTFGRYQIYNLLAAYSAVRALGYSFDNIETEKINLQSSALRGETVDVDGITFIVDCYNANPSSVKVGIESLNQINSNGRKILVIGEMLELGDESVKLHRQIGTTLSVSNADFICLVGERMNDTSDEALKHGYDKNKLSLFKNAYECSEFLKTKLEKNDLVYLKGSRGIGLEEILRSFESKRRNV